MLRLASPIATMSTHIKWLWGSLPYIVLLYATCLSLVRQLGIVYYPHGSYAAPAEGTVRHSDLLVPSASEALERTLKLLHHSVGSARGLEEIPTQHHVHHKAQEALPVCFQSKYLCQVHTLHNPRPPLPTSHQENQSSNSETTLDIGRRLGALGTGTTSRLRLSHFSARAFSSHRLAPAGSLAVKDPKPTSTTAPSNIFVTDHPISNAPGFVRVPQRSRPGGTFLPLRVQVRFADFIHPLESQLFELVVPARRKLVSSATANQPAPSESPTAAKQSGDPDLLYSGQRTQKAETLQATLQFAQVRSFFQVDAVPSALWWLRRAVTVDRRLGPLVLKVGEEVDDNQDKPEVGRCGLCTLPSLRRAQSHERHVKLGILEGADVLLLFRTTKTPEEKGSHVCQVDENYRPIAACISLPHTEAVNLYNNRSASFPDIVDQILKYIVGALAINTQALPYFLSWDPAWRKQALK